MTIEEKIEELDRLKTRMQEAKKAADDAEAEYKRHEQDTFEAMRGSGLQSLKLRGQQFIRRSTLYGHLEDTEAFEAWLRETDQADEFLEAKPRKRLINDLVRHLIESRTDPEEWPPGLGYYTQDYIARQKS